MGTALRRYSPYLGRSWRNTPPGTPTDALPIVCAAPARMPIVGARTSARRHRLLVSSHSQHMGKRGDRSLPQSSAPVPAWELTGARRAAGRCRTQHWASGRFRERTALARLAMPDAARLVSRHDAGTGTQTSSACACWAEKTPARFAHGERSRTDRARRWRAGRTRRRSAVAAGDGEPSGARRLARSPAAGPRGSIAERVHCDADCAYGRGRQDRRLRGGRAACGSRDVSGRSRKAA